METESSHAGDEEDTVVTISEYFDGLEAQELEADLILGGDEGKECTYPKGYLPRQAIFSCLTCCPDGNAGVCTACSIACHDGHEVVELWTRRHFRCDCGNMRFGSGVCKKFSSKDGDNPENVYNQNYKGVYCVCKRPYPDPEGEKHGEMLQCCICEDWFHEAHLGVTSLEEIPRDDDGEPLFDELICQSCVARLDFLHYYVEFLLPAGGATCTTSKQKVSVTEDKVVEDVKHEHTNTNRPSNAVANESVYTVDAVAATVSSITVINTSMRADDGLMCAGADSSESLTDMKILSPIDGLDYGNTALIDSKLSSGANASTEHFKLVNGVLNHGSPSSMSCKLNQRRNLLNEGVVKADCDGNELRCTYPCVDKALFLVKNWRAQLCRCENCCTLYGAKGVNFLLDAEDTLTQYEETAKVKHKEKREAEIGGDRELFNSLGHVGKIEFLHELNDMASEFSSYFASFGESGRTVTSADIHEFFDNLKRKKTRLS